MLGPWSKDVPALAEEYKHGDPFPLVVIDGFLDEDFANQLVAEFPSVDEMAHSKDYIFGDKREEADFAKAGPAAKAYHDLPAVTGVRRDRQHDHRPQALHGRLVPRRGFPPERRRRPPGHAR